MNEKDLPKTKTTDAKTQTETSPTPKVETTSETASETNKPEGQTEEPAASKKKSKKKWLIITWIAVEILIIGLFLAYVIFLASKNALDHFGERFAYVDGEICFGDKINSCGKTHDIIQTGKLRVGKTEPREVIKPNTYLYSKEEIEVNITLGHSDKVTTYSLDYQDSWQATATPDGSLVDLKSGHKLYALYMENQVLINYDTSRGFVVKSEDTASFLEEKLAYLGLNERETEEFIIYWLPKLQEHSYNYISFASSEEIDQTMPLIIDPKPDTTIRVWMLFKGFDNLSDLQSKYGQKTNDQNWNLPEPTLAPTPTRQGFTAVEWGGIEL